MELEWGTTYFHPHARLFIRNECGPQVLSVPVRAEPVLLGRGGGDKKPTSYIDLSALGASARMGVARYHAQIELQGDMLYLSDYGSGEGTVLNCKPIPSHVPIPLRNRSLVHLGGLAVRVQFV
jgi:hypothetical protein